MDNVDNWSIEKVQSWLKEKGFKEYSEKFQTHKIDGATLLTMTESDIKDYLGIKILGDLRRLLFHIEKLKKKTESIPTSPTSPEGKKQEFPKPSLMRHISSSDSIERRTQQAIASSWSTKKDIKTLFVPDLKWWDDSERESWSSSITKVTVSFLFLLLSLFMTSVVMTIVHERVPNPTTYPPLPDFILDNIDRIPIAFALSEVCAGILTAMMACVLLLHNHRMIIMRRMSVIIGTVFLLRCATMFITSLSVPGKHLTKCANTNMTTFEDKIRKAWEITTGFGLSVAGVYTCGDYMFSGHTSILTLMNYFILEYTPTSLRGIHILTWVLHIFGMFFILAAHEHYSIDVLIAFFVCDRVFQHYHTIANIHYAVEQNTGVDLISKNFFPLLGYLEEHSKGILVNEYGIPIYTWWKKRKNFQSDPNTK